MSDTSEAAGNSKERAAGIAAACLPWIAGALTLGVLAHASNLLDAAVQWSTKPSSETRLDGSLWLMVPAACNVGTLVLLVSGLRARGIAALGGLAVSWVLGALWPGLLWVTWAAPVAAAVLLLRGRVHAAARPALVTALLLTIVLSFAGMERFRALQAALVRPLDPDAQTFISLASRAGIYSTEFREPLFVWIYKLQGFVTGSLEPAAIRLMSVAISLAAVTAVFFFTIRFFGMTAGFVAGLLYAGAGYLVHFTSAQGLREEVIILLFFWLAAVMCRAWISPPRWQHWLHLALAGAVLLLLRMDSGVFLAGAYALLIARQVWSHRDCLRMVWLPAAAFVLAWLPMVPFMIQCKKLYGDPFYITAKAGPRFYANLEFAGVHPDFPTREQVKADAYAGPPIGMGQYLFKYHSVPEVLWRMATGAGAMTAGYHGRVWIAGFKHLRNDLVAALAWLQLAAMLLLLVTVNGRVLFLLLVLFHAPALFLVGTFPMTRGTEAFDPRLLTLAYTGYCVALGAMCQFGVDRSVAMLRGGSGAAALGAGDGGGESREARRGRARRRRTHGADGGK